MKVILIIAALSALLFGSKVDFIHDYDKALEMAQAQNKDIYMLVTSETCKWCRKFEKVTLHHEKTMQDLKKEYILLALNRDASSIPAKYKVKRVPKHFFLTAKGEVIYSIIGYWNPEDFASFVEEATKKKVGM